MFTNFIGFEYYSNPPSQKTNKELQTLNFSPDRSGNPVIAPCRDCFVPRHG